ncbi:hypothetical protein THAOC_22744, partial [Thalassiosira oceanica]
PPARPAGGEAREDGPGLPEGGGRRRRGKEEGKRRRRRRRRREGRGGGRPVPEEDEPRSPPGLEEGCGGHEEARGGTHEGPLRGLRKREKFSAESGPEGRGGEGWGRRGPNESVYV